MQIRHYIDKDTVVGELERRLKGLQAIKKYREWTSAELGDIACCKQLLSFLDTLKVVEVPEDNKVENSSI